MVKFDLTRRLHFIDFADIHFISALHGTGVGVLFKSVRVAWNAAHRQASTSQLNQILQRIVEKNPPPVIQGRRIKLRFMHQGGTHPPRFVIHGNQVQSMPEHYERYLINQLRTALKLHGTPISVSFKQGENPFEGKKNKLTPHQEYKRKRLMRHVKRNK
jgi:GTP-binding protein